MVGGGVVGGIAIGLLILRCTLLRLKRKEMQRRGYTADEMKGMDNVEMSDVKADVQDAEDLG